MNDLDRLFSDYEKLSQQRLEELKRQHKNEQQEREEAERLLTAVVLPVLERISAAIKQKGHQSEVTKKFDNRSSPSVTLSFTPLVVSERSAHVAASNLIFTHGALKGIEIQSVIKNDRGSNRLHSIYNAPKWEPVNFGEDAVESQAVAFIRAVLKAN